MGDSPDFFLQLVRLVNSHYGIVAHQALAKDSFATQRVGSKKDDNAPTANVMEYLLLASDNQGGWTTIYQFAQDNVLYLPSREITGAIRRVLNCILTLLEERGMIYSDMLSNNITIQVDEDGEPFLSDSGPGDVAHLKVVGPVRAGVTRELHYSLSRNNDVWWPTAFQCRATWKRGS